tara:strand:+ start:186 stop:1010 length:825 start_codon:yes stop_codon:yes gene_type:complete
MRAFRAIGTDNLRIGKCPKVGSCSLDNMVNVGHPIYEYHEYDDNTKYVVLIRDVMDKYKSGYKQDLLEKINHDPWPPIKTPHTVFDSFFHKNFTTTKVESFVSDDERIRWGVEQIVNSHQLRGDSSYGWLNYGHMSFWIWNQGLNDSQDGQLKWISELENVYFLELKDLSNPKFMEWLQQTDETWKDYRGWSMGKTEAIRKGVPHSNPTDEFFWDNMDLFWKEYTEGKIAKGLTLNSPFYPTENTEIKNILKDIESEQEVIDSIRDNHEKYLRL